MIIEISVFILGLFLIVFQSAKRLKRNGKFFLDPNRKEVDETILDEEQKAYYSELDKKLAALGFSFYKLLKNENWNAKSLSRLYSSPNQSEIFSMVETWAPAVPKRRVFTWKTRFMGGNYLVTGVPRHEKRLFSKLPHHTIQSFVDPMEPKELLEEHQGGLKKLGKSTERIYPERYPAEFDEEWTAFYKERIRKGDFMEVSGANYLAYTWKAAFRSVWILMNPFNRSRAIKNQWISLLIATALFFSVFWITADWVGPRLNLNDVRQLKTLILVYDVVVFYGAANVLSHFRGKRISAIYILGFIPLYWLFVTQYGIGILCVFSALFGMVTQEEKDKAKNEEETKSLFMGNISK